MPKTRVVALLLLSLVLCGCRHNTADPTAGHQRIKSASFSFELPPQTGQEEWVELEIPLDLGVRVGVVTSVELTGRMDTRNARHACGGCVSGEPVRSYSVVKSFRLTIRSGGGVYSFSNGARREEAVSWDAEAVECRVGCNDVFKDGTGVLQIGYGSDPLFDAFLCGETAETEVEFCSLEPGTVAFPDRLELKVTYHDYYLPPAEYWD